MALKRTKITVETETMTILRSARLESGWCADCGAEVQVVTLGEEGFRDPAAVEQVSRWKATGKLHGWMSAVGLQQICLKSLMRCMDVDEGLVAGFEETK